MWTFGFPTGPRSFERSLTLRKLTDQSEDQSRFAVRALYNF
ncbi:hypothetical protein CT19431_90002 [Cupriavidus taiwanensis]|nr:hypothetical protein CT19431_90002 [Cupriavidus taiwanensis]